MTEQEFETRFGITPDKAKELMEELANIVNKEVREVIRHANYYTSPTGYCDEEFLKEEFGADALEKDDDDDGYPNLYDFRTNSAEKVFMDFISFHTHYGGHTSAIEACELMGLKWRD